MSIRTILFDLDGTLIDTNELNIASFIYTFEQFNMSHTREKIKSFNGPPLRDTFHQIDPIKAENMISMYRKHNLFYHDHYVRAFPNVNDVLKQLKEKEIKLGIVTTKMRKTAMKGIIKTAIDPFFKTIITYDDVIHSKPHPEPVLQAMKQLGAQAASTLMVGDNYHDIEAGKNAGVQTAGVAWAHKGKDILLQYRPDYMLEDMCDLLKIVGV
ncbi:pyrophosphatase PpaX [Virgibacillus alimentarius]|uniref:pyrophosphatase PpaX n=1 Tax=Virgibacillus alimentarius TaxID=698769 RepID=UPI000493953A|nr:MULTISPECIES: pyrophosphatase PpaX [Virgibacillus]HLR65689.1 pyrophosphatase PpaX [Virgibacillus sp.]